MADVARLSLACQCGATLQGAARPASAGRWLTALWWLNHDDGDTHRPVTMREAALARARARRREARASHG